MPAGVNAIPGRTSSGTRRTLKLLVIVAALVLVAVGIVLNVGQGVGEVRLADGGVVRLERYEFRSDTVRYHQAKIPMAQALWNALPKKAKKRFVRFRPGVTAFVGPSFPNEPQLSTAFSARDAGKTAGCWNKVGRAGRSRPEF